MVRRYRQYQELGKRQGQISGCGGHSGGHGNGDCGNNYHNLRVILLQQVESNRTTPVTGIDRTTVDTECYYFHVTDHLSNNCPEVTVERCRNRGAGDRGSGGRTGTGMCQICVGLAHNYDGFILGGCTILLYIES